MKNKEFKQMVKDHIIKQQFILLYDNMLQRYYQTVEQPHRYYISEWAIKDGQLVRSNYETIYSTMVTGLLEFEEQVKQAQEDPSKVKQEINDCRIKQSGYPDEDIPMEQRKYWKLRAGALEFMLKYRENKEQG